MALATIAGVVAAMLNAGMIGPWRDQFGGLTVAAATSQALVDVPGTSIVHRRTVPRDVVSLIRRTELTGQVMVSSPVLAAIARHTGIPTDALGGNARFTGDVPTTFVEPNSEKRAADIAASRKPYQIEVEARSAMPILDIYAQAPTVGMAQRLADAAVPAFNAELRALAARQRFTGPGPARVRQLGPARGGVVSGPARAEIAVLTFLCAFLLTALGLLGLSALRARIAAAQGSRDAVAAPEGPSGSPREPVIEARRGAAGAGGDWPHTTRVLPWLLALFIAMLWLVPFNDIQLNASLPIDIQPDRLLLPVIFAVWLGAIAIGGLAAPRITITWIHVALGAFLLCALTSVALNARYLNHILEFELSLKKLPLLLSYMVLFLIVSSTVRRTEVGAFLTYMLILAAVCGAGIAFEYRFKQNLFYDAAHRFFPASAFDVGQAEPRSVDEIGRRLVRGPAGVGLEAVTMLSLALPIALVQLMRSTTWRSRALTACATAAIVAGAVATYRKSGLLVPLAAIAPLAYFRRRELLRLAPLGVVLLVVVSVVSPGALSSTLAQFTRSDRGSVTTVSDRRSDYDAVRPDVWTHIVLGRGYGSYDHDDYRILDSEILYRTIETGVIGLLAFLLIGVAVIACARGPIALRDAARAPPALIGAAGTFAFFVAAVLYDILAFPHAVYLFLLMAAFVAVVADPARRPRPRWRSRLQGSGPTAPVARPALQAEPRHGETAVPAGTAV